MIPLLLFLIGISQKQVDSRPIVLDGISDHYASELVFVSTRSGTYAFDRDSETWSRRGRSDAAYRRPRVIGLDEGILWIGTDEGLTSSDLLTDDWQTYDLPGSIEALAFDEEYVWVGGDSGVARFDKYLESWQSITDRPVRSLHTDKGDIWLATETGIVRYSGEFEKLQEEPAAPVHDYSLTVETPNRLWFLSSDLLAAYTRADESWSTYQGLTINDYCTLGDSLFVLSEGGVYLYEPGADDWSPFRDIEPTGVVRGIFLHGSRLLFAGDDGVLEYDLRERTRQIYNKSSGLVTDSIEDAYEDSRFLYLFSRSAIQVLKRETDVWVFERLADSGGGLGRTFYLDDAGLHARLPMETDLRLAGRAYYAESRTISGDVVSVSDYENVNLRLIGEQKSGRFSSLYYDDTDKDRVEYGFGYRGLSDDLLYRMDGGLLRSEYFEFDLIPEFSALGMGTRLRLGPHALAVQGGELRSKAHSEFFTGRSVDKSASVWDTGYLRNTFYRIYDQYHGVDRGSDTVFVDDGLPSTDGIETRHDYTIGDITGDFDPLLNGIDYFLDYERGVVHFLSPRGEADLIVLFLGGQEIVLQSNSIDKRALENVYFLGPKIIPNSLSLTIVDTLGNAHPLHDFGLDDDRDGQPDAHFVDHELGYLEFPVERPFPDQVYNEGLHVYTMEFEFRSLSTFYRLSAAPVVEGSERIYIDGELMVRNSDYVMDYTSGVILLLGDETVSDFGEIEVHYSSREDLETNFYSVQPCIALADGALVAPGVSVIDTVEIGHISGQFQAVGSRGRRIRFVPQVAIERGDRWAQDYSVTGSYGFFSMDAQYRRVSPGFNSLGAGRGRHGDIRTMTDLAAAIEPSPFLRVDGHLRRLVETDSVGEQKSSRYTSAKLSFLRPSLLDGHFIVSRNDLPDQKQRGMRLNTNWDLRAGRSGLLFNSSVGHTSIEREDGQRNSVLDYRVAGKLASPWPIHANLELRRSDKSVDGTAEESNDERRVTVTFDAIPGIHCFANYRLNAISYDLGGSEDVSLEHYSYGNVNVAPGRWHPRLSVVNLSFGVGNGFDQYVRNLPLDRRRPLLIFTPIEDGSPSSVTNTRNQYGTIQLTPSANILIWAKRSVSRSGVAYHSTPALTRAVTDEIRMELEPGGLGIFTGQLTQTTDGEYPKSTLQSVFFEWSMPWSEAMRTKFTSTFWRNRDDYSRTSQEDSEVRTNLETSFRFGTRSFVTLDLGGYRRRSLSGETYHAFTPGAGINLNVLEFLYLQFDWRSEFQRHHEGIHLLSSKVIGQF